MNIVTTTTMTINTIDKPNEDGGQGILIAVYRDGDLGRMINDCHGNKIKGLVKDLITNSFAIYKGFRFIRYNRLIEIVAGNHQVCDIGLVSLTSNEIEDIKELVYRTKVEHLK